MAGASRHAPDAVYWSVGRSVASYSRHLPDSAECLHLEYSAEDARLIGNVRTDFDRFRPAEQAVLENHGYLLADAALRAHLPGRWRPDCWPALSVPFPAWLSAPAVRQALRMR